MVVLLLFSPSFTDIMDTTLCPFEAYDMLIWYCGMITTVVLVNTSRHCNLHGENI